MIHYTKEYIEPLLARFMDGETTLDEEDVLASYFATADVPAEWADYREMFAEFARFEVGSRKDDGLSSRDEVRGTKYEDGVSRTSNLKPQTSTPKHQTSNLKPQTSNLAPWLAAAAVVGVLFGIGLWTQRGGGEPGATLPVSAEHMVAAAQNDSLTTPETPRDTLATPAVKPVAPQRPARPPRVNDAARQYVLMAEAQVTAERAEQEVEEARREVERCRAEVRHAQLTALGYKAVREDGETIYINEDEESEYYAYEED